ncbi:MAG: hypothetical protein LAT76_07345 [Schleiferiaceae bacterium]|nr:hypothetical protein [Schleiferiaceae bacterium]
MKRIILLLISVLVFGSCKNKIVIFDQKFSQKDICADLGYGKKCNPFPYGTPFFFNFQRPSIPVGDSLSANSSTISELLCQFLGGVLVNDYMIAPSQVTLQDDWVYVFEPIKLEREVTTISQIEFKTLIKDVMTNSNLDSSLENEIFAFGRKYFNDNITIELFYHSINLNGNWYNDFMTGDTNAIKVNTYNNTKEVRNNRYNPFSKKCIAFNKVNDKTHFIGGIGAIEYRVSNLEEFKVQFEAKFGNSLGQIAVAEISANIVREVQTKISVPKRLDVVFASFFSPKCPCTKKVIR